MINKILISRDKRIILHRDKRTLGMNGENLQEVLLFVLDEKVEGTGIVEVELPDGTKGMIEVNSTEEGYELPVKSSLLTQTGFVKFQLRILHDDVEIFKSEILPLEVKDSINATATIPEEYPSWIDTLTNLKQDLEKAEQERVLNENERISAEKERQENFTEMQKTVESAVSNIKDLTEEYNSNAEKETKKFNDNAAEQTKSFNENSDTKLAEYNKNHTDKEKEFNDNFDTKTKTFDDNAESKQNEYNQNAENKLTEYNQNAEELINKVEQVQAENKLIKEQIPSANISGNSIYIEDSSNLDFDWKIKGGHAQTRTTQTENYIDDREARGKTILEATSLYLPIINLKAGSGYYFKIFDSNDKIKNDSRYLAVEFYDINKTKIQSDALGYPNTFTEENANKIKFAKIYYNKNDTDKAIGSIVIKKIGLKITSSASADDIDMFVPDSPSPDYPSEVETVGSNVNLLTYPYPDTTKTVSGITFTDVGDGTVIANGTATKTVYFNLSRPTLNKGKYYLSGIPSSGSSKTYEIKFGTHNYYYGGTFEVTESQFIPAESYIKINKDNTVNDLVFKPKLEKDTVATPYSPPGMGCVEIDVVNSNLLDFNVAQNSRVTVNEDGTLTINGTGGFSLNIDKLQLKAGITYYQKVELISGSISVSNINNTFLSFAGAGAWISSEKFSQTNLTKDTEKTTIWINASAIFNNAVIKIWANTDKSDFVLHQSQTAIMSIQQAMLEGDYVADVEHHEWGKLTLTGNENIKLNTVFANVFNIEIPKINIINQQVCLCNIAKGVVYNTALFTTQDNIIMTASPNKIVYRSTKFSSLSEFKTYLQNQYEKGTPVIVYYKLAEPINLELTEEQKAVREQKLYTYKNITNISLSDELASIDVEYKKDLETEHNKLQNEIDEIKQLISTTETSALLLDNLQKDVESEVE